MRKWNLLLAVAKGSSGTGITLVNEKARKLEEVLDHWKEARRSPSQSKALLGMVSLLLTMIRQLDELENHI